MVASTIQVVVSPTVAEAALEAATISSKVAAAKAAGRSTIDPSQPESAHDMSMNGMTE